MKSLYYILLLLLYPTNLLSEEVEIIIFSESITIDTIDPEIEILSPSHGDSFQQGDQILVTWDAYDQSPASYPMTLNVSADLDDSYIELASNFPDIGSLELGVPGHINTLFASIRLDIVDFFGNMTSAYSDGYFILGNPNENIYDVINEHIAIQATSINFEVDTKPPEVMWIYPNESTSFIPGQGQLVRWDATDDSFTDNPIDLLFIDGGVDSYILSEDNVNNEQAFINLPDITTSLGHFKIVATDRFGNINNDLSDEYMSIGPNSNTELEEESAIVEVLSSPFIMDTKMPSFNLINETDYFYPNGGEILNDYNDVNLDWNCYDESFNDGLVEVSLGYLLGGWYTVIDTFHHSTTYVTPTDLSLNGIVDNTIWGRLIFTAIDDFGNRNSKYNDDYFVLGSPDGDIDIELYDEDELDMMLSWTWTTEQHTIKILNRAINFLNEGDQVVIVGSNSISSTECGSDNGYIELNSQTCEVNPSGNLKLSPIKTHIGIDHCTSGGGRLSGYVEEDSIRFKVLSGTESYFIRPSLLRGSSVFDNTVTVIEEFNLNPYDLDIESNNNHDLASRDDRDADNFNVYSKVTNHQSNFRNCDNDGVCDSSELLSNYLNEDDCLSNSGIWDETYCYYDFNNDGQYSPDEVDENIGDCYSDCCTEQGSGDNQDWCFVEEVSDEVYTHSLVQQNYVANQQSSATINYRVWVLDDAGNELFKTVETDGVDINIESNQIGTYTLPLSSGWNWFSLNIHEGNGNMTLNNLFSNSVLSNNDYIKGQTSSSQYYSAGGVWYPEIALDVKSMYMLYMNSESELSYSGLYASESDSIFISNGWNWIGYIPTSSNSINTALSSIMPSNGDYIKSQTSSSQYYTAGGVWYPDISMEPMNGYMLDADNIDTLNYSTDNRDNYGNDYVNEYLWDFNYRDYEYSASITIKPDIDYLHITENDQIAVFNNNECVGIAKADICPLNNEILFNLMYYSNQMEVDDLKLKYYNSATNSYYDIRERIDFQADTYIGNAFEPFLVHDGTLPEEFALLDPYPNPFNPITKIDFTLPDDVDNILINIYDIRGRLVNVLLENNMSSGYHSLYWNAELYSSGIYFVHMIADNNTFIKKITLLK